MHPWTPGIPVTLEPGLRLVLAPNPSPMTHWGTNTFLIGTGDVAVIDPGPALPDHLEALLAALDPGERISHILVTHAHLDHSPLARPLADRCGATILAHGDARSGRSPRMAALAGLGGGEGVDHRFAPDTCLRDGDSVSGTDWALTALHTPGHMGGHLCFGWGDRLFSGDHVMGWAPSLVSPPEGDMTDYMASLARLDLHRWRRAFPAHGAPIDAPHARFADLTHHRQGREAAILAALQDVPADLDTLTARVYHDVAPALLPAARRNLLAHLIDLTHRNKISAHPAPLPDAQFFRR
ncbi:hydroxyacylglutathione hydrolase [Gemmobacter aquatilis]|uniref:Hydroxyacylglutathione hydrolase n=1 Tax=Gemmobacter aquatilis TaxID=933059 RepID=A0A1H8BVF6_9RHOB|nr:MBL fold metallo-hydrolase [Gemmobacter aquatilis]SEM86830.1 hydroxyacylglutathione hydrolase [Gemmobacter aquatilis]